MNINISKTNKILLVLVIILAAILVGLYIWQKMSAPPAYHAVYLRTGELYFGKLVKFPWFGMKQVYTIQVNQQDEQNPISVQRFANVFWGPKDWIKLNRDNVIWITELNPEGQLAQLIKTNPNLMPMPPAPAPAPSPSPAPAPSQNQ